MKIPKLDLSKRTFRPLDFASRFKKTVVGRVFNKLTARERTLVILLIGTVVVSGTLLIADSIRDFRSGLKGGTYTEGLVAASLADVEPEVQALTNDSLLTSDSKGALVGELAESWNVSDDAATIELQLKKDVDRSVVMSAIDPSVQGSPFAGTTVESFDSQGIRIHLKESFAPFLATLTKPMIPVGPYIVSDRSKEKVVLVARPNYFKGEPKLDSVVLEVFPTVDSLQQALDHNQIDGVDQVSVGINLPKTFTDYSLTLPRKTAAFFNLNNDVVKDIAVRQKLVDRTNFDQTINLNVVTTETLIATDAVQKLLNDWAKANVHVSLKVLSAAQVQTDIIPPRNYDVLIFGIDLGADPDLYPFWHSTQRGANGLNLSNFANVNADKLMEQARKTGKSDDRTNLYNQVNQIIADQKPWLLLDEPKLEYAIDKSIVGPVSQVGFYTTDRFKNISTWYINR